MNQLKHKPDRFTRMVEGLFVGQYQQKKCIELLRREHRWAVRMVKQLKIHGDYVPSDQDGYIQACDDLLAQLKERAKT